jgi:hypothetical protein
LCSQTFAQSQAAEIDKFDLTKLFKPNTRRGDFLTTFLNTPSYKFLDKDYWSDFHISDIASAAQLMMRHQLFDQLVDAFGLNPFPSRTITPRIPFAQPFPDKLQRVCYSFMLFWLFSM